MDALIPYAVCFLAMLRRCYLAFPVGSRCFCSCLALSHFFSSFTTTIPSVNTMRALFTLVKASLLALLPFLFATAKSVTLGPDFVAHFATPPLTQLAVPANALLTALFGYEAAARLVPTERNWSAFSALLRAVNEFLANRATGYVSGQPSYHGLAI